MADERDPAVWRIVFNAFDRDESGRIDRAELIRALRNLGGRWTEERISNLLYAYDADGGGALSFPQFLEMVTGRASLVDPELVRAFRAMDLDGDGRITTEELLGLFNAAGVNAKAEVAEFIQEGDIDGDGSISFQEFLMIAGKSSDE